MNTDITAAATRQFPHLLLLEASAGSGKTHALSRRYVEFLLADGIAHNRPANVLAITFTKNAAREMKERILAWLKALALGTDETMMSEIQHELGTGPAEITLRSRALLDAIIGQYADFQVRTIDSFTNRLAQAAARDLGFRPDFTVTTDQQELVEYALAMLYQRIGPGRDRELTAVMDEFLALLNAGGNGFAWDPRQRLRDRFQAFLGIEAKESGRLVFTDQRETIKRLLGELRGVHDEVKGFAVSNGLPWQDHEVLLKYIDDRNFNGIFGRTTYDDDNTLIKAAGLNKAQKAMREQSKRIWGRSRRVVAELAVAVASNDMAAFHLPYAAFKRELDGAKSRQGVCHIDDISRRLAETLRLEMIPEIYLALGARISHYLIDEFQDTDPAQWRSLHPLLCEALAADGSAFLVGDLKQAIYMFRKADYRIMRGLKAEIEGRAPRRWLPASVAGKATVSHLDRNYRSGQAIVEYAEQTFRQVLPQLITAGRYGPDRTGLTSYRQSPSPDNLGRGYVSVRHFKAAAGGATSAPQDAGYGAAATSDLADVDNGAALRQALLAIIADVTGRGYGYGDIAVLAATNDALERTIDWLNQAGIPAASSSGLDIRKRRVVAELLALLRWLDSPIDNLAWATVVSSRILARAAQAGGARWDSSIADALLLTAGQRADRHGYLYRECRRDRAFTEIWQRYFGELYRLAGFSPVYDMACLAVATFEVLQNFPEETAAVLQLLEAVNRHETDGRGAVSDFLDACERNGADNFGLELPEQLPAVQLLTFFKAKGMGFPVVINLLAEGGGGRSPVHYGVADGEIAVYHITKNIAARSAGYPVDLDALRSERESDEQVQRLNSLYVACTRARDELYNLVSCPPPDTRGQLPNYELLFPQLERGTRRVRAVKAADQAVPPLQPRVHGGARTPAHWRSEDAWTLPRYLDARQGEYLHRVLQDIEYCPPDLERLAAALLLRHRGLAPSADPEKLLAPLCAFLRNPALAEWFAPANNRVVAREAEFITREGSVVRMDRLVADPGRVTVIDFKTGGERPGDQDSHRAQLSLYLNVLRDVYPALSIAGLIAYWDRTMIEVLP